MNTNLYHLPSLPECGMHEHPLLALQTGAESPAQAEALQAINGRLHHILGELMTQEAGMMALLSLLNHAETQTINCGQLECLLMPIVARMQHTTSALNHLID